MFLNTVKQNKKYATYLQA